MIKEELYKNRSYGRCIKDGYRTLTDNFREIFRRSWPTTLAVALIGGALLTVCLCYVYMPIAAVVAAVLFLMAVLVWYGKIYSLLGGGSLWHNTLRTLCIRIPATLIMLIVTALLMGVHTASIYIIGPEKQISVQTAYIFIGVSVVIATIVLLLTGLPLTFCCMKYQFEEKSKLWRTLTDGYWRGMKHIGLLMAVAIIVGIISAVIEIVVFSPCNILIMVSNLSNAGVAQGDAAGLPSYFPALVFAAGFITSFCMAYLAMWIEFTFYYTYGTIETREDERLKAKSAIYRP